MVNMEFRKWLEAAQKPDHGADLRGLITNACLNRNDRTVLAPLADKLQEIEDPGWILVHDELLKSPDVPNYRSSKSIVPPGWTYGDPLPKEPREAVYDRTTETPIRIERNLRVDADTTTNEPIIRAGFFISHTRPKPAKKVWNDSRTSFRAFYKEMTLDQARQWANMHKSSFRKKALDYLNAYFPADGRLPAPPPQRRPGEPWMA